MVGIKEASTSLQEDNQCLLWLVSLILGACSAWAGRPLKSAEFSPVAPRPRVAGLPGARRCRWVPTVLLCQPQCPWGTGPRMTSLQCAGFGASWEWIWGDVKPNNWRATGALVSGTISPQDAWRHRTLTCLPCGRLSIDRLKETPNSQVNTRMCNRVGNFASQAARSTGKRYHRVLPCSRWLTKTQHLEPCADSDPTAGL